MRSPVRLFNPQGPDRVAVVSATPAYGRAGLFLLQVARGPRTLKLTGGTAFGPFTEAELPARFDQVVAELKQEGYVETGLTDLFVGLDSPKAKVRAKAALHLAWRGHREAAPLIAAKVATAGEDLCSLVDAIGMLGDRQFAGVIRPVAGRKLLSRRRSAVEALIKLQDVDGLTAAIPAALEKLPETIRVLAETADADPLRTAVAELPLRQLGLVLDTLYELAGIFGVIPDKHQRAVLLSGVVRGLLDVTDPGQPFVWRYVKSISKRAMLRGDLVLWGWLSHRLEQLAAKGAAGMTAKVKSGLDGVEREMPIFRRRTQVFMRRLSWRWLRTLARHRPADYSKTAAECLIHYSEADAQTPRGLVGAFAGCYLLHRILHGASKRFRLMDRSLRFRFVDSKKTQTPAGVREEAFAELWDAEPRAYLRLLGAARLEEVQAFAHTALPRHPDLIRQATIEELLPMLSVAYEPTVRLAVDEIRGRFDPAKPDLNLLDSLLRHVRPETRERRPVILELAEGWLRVSSRFWARDFERAVRYLQLADGPLRNLVGGLVTAALEDRLLEGESRKALAVRVLAELRAPLTENLDALAALAGGPLAEDLERLLSLEDVLALIASSLPEVQAVGAQLLARRPEAAAGLGLERLAGLANHGVFGVRQVIAGLFRSQRSLFAEDPSLLFALVESEWPDTRLLAGELLRTQIDWATAGIDRLMGLVDSNRTDVQDLGCELLRQHLGSLDVAEVVARVIQHPHPHVRPFAMLLVEKHLPAGVASLARLEDFCRSALLDVWPSRKLKRRVVQFLLARGLIDLEQAKFAATILQDAIRVRCQGDFEAALIALARLKLAWPELSAGVSVREEAGV